MNILIIQHAGFETAALLNEWTDKAGHKTRIWHVYKNGPCPSGDFEAAFLMGGPMSAFEEEDYPWLSEEKRWLKQFISEGRKALGICLGAQILADVLGACVYPGEEKEIGFFPVIRQNRIRGWNLPETLTPLHWHGDTFDLPDNSQLLYSSRAVPHQAFLWNNQVLALQYHLEMDINAQKSILNECSAELDTNRPFIQDADTILKSAEICNQENRKILYNLMDNFIDN